MWEIMFRGGLYIVIFQLGNSGTWTNSDTSRYMRMFRLGRAPKPLAAMASFEIA